MNKNQLLNYWEENFRSSGLKPELLSSYYVYVKTLIENRVPIIFDFEHLCLLLGRSKEYLASAINSPAHHYRSFQIPKKKGGGRNINSPYPALLECQYWVYENILKSQKIHPTAQGFTIKKSIITNSQLHVSQKEFLKIDIKDFFPSIKINRVISVFQKLGYTNHVSFYLASLCCLNEELPQGAPTSPVLSNIISIHLDKRLFAFAKKFNLRYTRYADDLAFSGESIPPILISYISRIISESGFQVNSTKTILHKTRGKRILTGISIANDQIKLPRDYKRKLKQEIHFIRTYGLSSHIRKKKIKNPNYLESIIGKVCFWLNVEPESNQATLALEYLRKLKQL